MNLSEHFTLDELTRSNHDIPNVPNKEQIGNLTTLCERVLEPLRARFNAPVIITSGFRSPELNMLVGGSKTSQHPKGEAADLRVRGIANAVVWKYIVANLEFDQVIAERLSKNDGQAGWIHVSFSKNNRKEALSFVKGKYIGGLEYEKS